MTTAKWKGKKQGDEGYEFLSGVPARDLSDDDYAALDTDQKASVRASSLYDVQTASRSSSHSSAPSAASTSSSGSGSGEAKS